MQFISAMTESYVLSVGNTFDETSFVKRKSNLLPFLFDLFSGNRDFVIKPLDLLL